MSTLRVNTIQDETGTTAMTIDTSGRILTPARPRAHVSLTTDTVGSSTSGYPAIVFNVANLNIGGHYNTSNGKFTCPIAGIYQVTGYAMDKDSSAAGGFYLRVLLDGSNYGADAGSYDAGGSHAGAHISALIQCTAGQEITLGYYSTSGAMSGYTGATFMLVG